MPQPNIHVMYMYTIHYTCICVSLYLTSWKTWKMTVIAVLFITNEPMQTMLLTILRYIYTYCSGCFSVPLTDSYFHLSVSISWKKIAYSSRLSRFVAITVAVEAMGLLGALSYSHCTDLLIHKVFIFSDQFHQCIFPKQVTK